MQRLPFFLVLKCTKILLGLLSPHAAPGSLPGRGKQQRQSNSKRSGHEREQGRANGRSSSSSGSTSMSGADSLALSMGQLSAGDRNARSNNKKNQVSLNHLLNFSFPVREEPQNTGPVRRRRNANYQPFDKDKFINAKYGRLETYAGQHRLAEFLQSMTWIVF